jgi:thioesterase domain-containing protein
VKEKLPDYMVPSAFVTLKEMPLTQNGKVDRRALPAPNTEGLAEKEYVAPRDALEMELTKIWESVLGLKSIGIRDDFFELGGHSLLAVRVFGQIGKVIDVDLPLSILFQAPTIELLAAVLRKRSGVVRVAGTSLVELHGEGSLRPLFCVHPGSGNIFCYIELSRLLGKDQPVYAFQSRALEKGAAWPSIEQMAEHYIELLRGVQTEGPYCLGGLSLGGVVAFEMSRQLEDAGQEVSLLAIIDAPAPRVMKKLPADDLFLMLDFAEVMGVVPASISLSQEEALQMSVRERLAYVLDQGQREGAMPLEITLATIERLWEVFQENVRALMVYGGGNYEGKATLFRTADTAAIYSSEGNGMGWEELVTGGVQVEELPGTHYTIVQKPHVGILASRLRAHLHEAQMDELFAER